MRSAISRADNSIEFIDQQSFDCAVARLVRLIPIPAESAEWFSEKDLVPTTKRTWKNTLRNPAVLAISIAIAVIAGVFVFNFVSHLHDFSGSATARKLLGVAASTRPVMLDPVNAEAGALSDLFFMKYGLEHYDVPEEFADLAPLVAAFLKTTNHGVSLKSGSQRNACSSFSFPPRETARPEQCCGFPAGAMFIRKAGQVR
jgi:hypothetical protein